MKKFILTSLCVLFSAAAVCAGADEPLANDGKRGLYAKSLEQVLRLREDEVDLATAALIVSEYWSDLVYGRRYLSRLDDMAFEIRDRLKAAGLPTDHRAIRVINEYLFKELGFASVPEISDPNDLFLHSVLDKKRGYCLSLSILYLAIAERLGLPVYGVVAPGHFFVRYDDGQVRFNIETTSAGGTADDEHYIEKFKVPQTRRDSIYMQNLNKIQTLGCLLNNLGNTYSEVGNIDSALTALERAVQINPSLAESHMNLGNIYLRKGRVNDAIYEYRSALKIKPDDAKSHLNLGNAYTERGWLRDAIDEYHLSLKLDANIIDTYKNLATAYCKQEMFGQAIGQLRRAIALQPKDSSLYSWLGDVYRQMGDCEKAIPQYEKALAMKSDLALAYYGLGLCYNKMGLLDDEIEQYRRVLYIEPDMLGALVNLGNAYVRKEKFDAAIEQYDKAIQIKPDDATIYYNLGTAYINKGNYQKAVAEYREAIRLEPSMGDAHNGLAYGYYRLEKYNLALEHIRIAQELGVAVDEKLLAAIQDRVR
ncbi:MAG TPA: tetratricopeptide repeat protein [Sedimentisphaerales bacterium]|nr:tetratricopeptide repeat protein [Sedimentisphaerales bacterium]